MNSSYSGQKTKIRILKTNSPNNSSKLPKTQFSGQNSFSKSQNMSYFDDYEYYSEEEEESQIPRVELKFPIWNQKIKDNSVVNLLTQQYLEEMDEVRRRQMRIDLFGISKSFNEASFQMRKRQSAISNNYSQSSSRSRRRKRKSKTGQRKFNIRRFQMKHPELFVSDSEYYSFDPDVDDFDIIRRKPMRRRKPEMYSFDSDLDTVDDDGEPVLRRKTHPDQSNNEFQNKNNKTSEDHNLLYIQSDSDYYSFDGDIDLTDPVTRKPIRRKKTHQNLSNSKQRLNYYSVDSKSKEIIKVEVSTTDDETDESYETIEIPRIMPLLKPKHKKSNKKKKAEKEKQTQKETPQAKQRQRETKQSLQEVEEPYRLPIDINTILPKRDSSRSSETNRSTTPRTPTKKKTILKTNTPNPRLFQEPNYKDYAQEETDENTSSRKKKTILKSNTPNSRLFQEPNYADYSTSNEPKGKETKKTKSKPYTPNSRLFQEPVYLQGSAPNTERSKTPRKKSPRKTSPRKVSQNGTNQANENSMESAEIFDRDKSQETMYQYSHSEVFDKEGKGNGTEEEGEEEKENENDVTKVLKVLVPISKANEKERIVLDHADNEYYSVSYSSSANDGNEPHKRKRRHRKILLYGDNDYYSIDEDTKVDLKTGKAIRVKRSHPLHNDPEYYSVDEEDPVKDPSTGKYIRKRHSQQNIPQKADDDYYYYSYSTEEIDEQTNKAIRKRKRRKVQKQNQSPKSKSSRSTTTPNSERKSPHSERLSPHSQRKSQRSGRKSQRSNKSIDSPRRKDKNKDVDGNYESSSYSYYSSNDSSKQQTKDHSAKPNNCDNVVINEKEKNQNQITVIPRKQKHREMKQEYEYYSTDSSTPIDPKTKKPIKKKRTHKLHSDYEYYSVDSQTEKDPKTGKYKRKPRTHPYHGDNEYESIDNETLYDKEKGKYIRQRRKHLLHGDNEYYSISADASLDSETGKPKRRRRRHLLHNDLEYYSVDSETLVDQETGRFVRNKRTHPMELVSILPGKGRSVHMQSMSIVPEKRSKSTHHHHHHQKQQNGYDLMDPNFTNDTRTMSTKGWDRSSPFRSNSPKMLRHSQPVPSQSFVRTYNKPIKTVKRPPNIPTPAQQMSIKPITVERFYD